MKKVRTFGDAHVLSTPNTYFCTQGYDNAIASVNRGLVERERFSIAGKVHDGYLIREIEDEKGMPMDVFFAYRPRGGESRVFHMPPENSKLLLEMRFRYTNDADALNKACRAALIKKRVRSIFGFLRRK
ncbi:hypothetical protein COU36_00060 [Candidatus Micrarchaeota archaeon CG10_big_fil_rev_8_21_14_0_10_59_7]|nr:MAG: hypothetical protein COU36_00060 [Candidatus Micrarchaeota archaeon CG10_big_fil_rev_8_21_14_0_10_59_7]